MSDVNDLTEQLDETAHPTIEYLAFGLDGEESLRSGYIWAPAPQVKGMRAFWVLPVERGAVGPLAVAVVRASRRHRVGAVLKVRGQVRWLPARGRYVDIGTFYTEVSAGSPSGALTTRGANPGPAPTWLHVPPLDELDKALLSGKRDPFLLQ